MSLLGLYDFSYWPWDEDLIDEDDHPDPIPELLTITNGCGWWSDTSLLPDLD